MSFNFDFNYVKNGTPIVTLSSLGIAFNRASREALHNPKRILIGYDMSAHVIGVKAANEGDTGALYEFASRVKNDWVRIGCKDFIKHLAIETGISIDKKAIQFIAEYDSELEMLVICVDEMHMKSAK
jgi:hypothetical protein